MFKRISAILGALALTLGIGMATAAPSMAATNGRHVQTFSCTGGGTTKAITITYDIDGIGDSDPNTFDLVAYVWHTTPNADLDRIQLTLDTNGNGTHDANILLRGDEASTYDDVPAEAPYTTTPTAPTITFADNTSGEIRWSTYGGVNSSSDPHNHCWQDKNPI